MSCVPKKRLKARRRAESSWPATDPASKASTRPTPSTIPALLNVMRTILPFLKGAGMREHGRLPARVPEHDVLVGCEPLLHNQPHQAGHRLPSVHGIQQHPLGPRDDADRIQTRRSRYPISFPNIVVVDNEIVWMRPPPEIHELDQFTHDTQHAGRHDLAPGAGADPNHLNAAVGEFRPRVQAGLRASGGTGMDHRVHTDAAGIGLGEQFQPRPQIAGRAGGVAAAARDDKGLAYIPALLARQVFYDARHGVDM